MGVVSHHEESQNIVVSAITSLTTQMKQLRRKVKRRRESGRSGRSSSGIELVFLKTVSVDQSRAVEDANVEKRLRAFACSRISMLTARSLLLLSS